MSILRSLQIGVAGLRAHSEALGVAGDNIANVNTVGFKRSRAEFEEMIGRSVSRYSPPKVAGGGSRIGNIEQMWSQGALLNTDAPTDLAIAGEGFFIVEGVHQGQDSRFYTRAGQFQIDRDGQLVNSDGLVVQGYNVRSDGTIESAVSDLVVSSNTIPASATTQVDLAVNLDAGEQVGPVFDATDPTGTSNFATNVTVYDSLGAAHELTVFFRKSASNAWEWHAMVDDGELTGGTAGTLTEQASGTLTFNTDGALDTETTTASNWNFVDAAQNQAIAFDFGTSLTTDGGATGLDGSTQFATANTTTGLSQDGFPAGSVSGLSISSDGMISGVFNNGQMRPLGRIALANFTNLHGLERSGQGLWSATDASGDVMVGNPDTGGRGSILSGSLEQSNVDLGNEFVNLISYQRGFQANSRVITTADDMYSELVNIKR
ncbi:MAG: flagellar hook protein FlgE [Myxococcales bacterium]|nr:flagellar hook protein FlgE [Myxococcales bacterium]MDD9968319.1 flagellar hook protein FlgE [Myxococcales bacterium]